MNDQSRKKVIDAYRLGVDNFQEELSIYLAPLFQTLVVNRSVDSKITVLIDIKNSPIFGYPMLGIIRIFMRLRESFVYSYCEREVEGTGTVSLEIVIEKVRLQSWMRS